MAHKGHKWQNVPSYQIRKADENATAVYEVALEEDTDQVQREADTWKEKLLIKALQKQGLVGAWRRPELQPEISHQPVVLLWKSFQPWASIF